MQTKLTSTKKYCRNCPKELGPRRTVYCSDRCARGISADFKLGVPVRKPPKYRMVTGKHVVCSTCNVKGGTLYFRKNHWECVNCTPFDVA